MFIFLSFVIICDSTTKNCFDHGAQISEFGTKQQKLIFCFTQRQIVKNDNQKAHKMEKREKKGKKSIKKSLFWWFKKKIK